jgi:hypothetical protein
VGGGLDAEERVCNLDIPALLVFIVGIVTLVGFVLTKD